jgi:hypothetical protein
MKKAYIATGELATVICAFDENPAKALKKIARLIDSMTKQDDWAMLSSINVGYNDGTYELTATITTLDF